jgi:hypothetical protein
MLLQKKWKNLPLKKRTPSKKHLIQSLVLRILFLFLSSFLIMINLNVFLCIGRSIMGAPQLRSIGSTVPYVNQRLLTSHRSSNITVTVGLSIVEYDGEWKGYF